MINVKVGLELEEHPMVTPLTIADDRSGGQGLKTYRASDGPIRARGPSSDAHVYMLGLLPVSRTAETPGHCRADLLMGTAGKIHNCQPEASLPASAQSDAGTPRFARRNIDDQGLSDCRIERRMSTVLLAIHAGITVRHLEMIEVGTKTPTLPTLRKLAEVPGVRTAASVGESAAGTCPSSRAATSPVTTIQAVVVHLKMAEQLCHEDFLHKKTVRNMVSTPAK
jgi:hypothetical protein